MCFPTGLPDGSMLWHTLKPFFFRNIIRSSACVVLPEPSMPSMTMYEAVMCMIFDFGVLIVFGWGLLLGRNLR